MNWLGTAPATRVVLPTVSLKLTGWNAAVVNALEAGTESNRGAR